MGGGEYEVEAMTHLTTTERGIDYSKRSTLKLFHTIFYRLAYLLSLYVCVAALYAVYMYLLFYFTIQLDKPHITGADNMLQLNPGISIVPNPNRLTSLVHVRVSQPISYSAMADEISAFMTYYNVYGAGGMYKYCGAQLPAQLSLRRSCKFNTDAIGPCSLSSGYGYFRGEPCFIVKLNRIYGWLPDIPSNDTGVHVKCEGFTQRDTDHLGQVCYYDMQSLKENYKVGSTRCSRDYGILDSYFYPFLNQGNYQSPLVFVQFRNPRRHVVIWVKCYAIARNIHVNIHRNEGSMLFQLLVD